MQRLDAQPRIVRKRGQRKLFSYRFRLKFGVLFKRLARFFYFVRKAELVRWNYFYMCKNGVYFCNLAIDAAVNYYFM